MDRQTGDSMNEWMCRLMDGWMDRQMGKWMDGSVDGRKNEWWINEWVGEWEDGWMCDAWMNG